jgi:hypothetical protein
MQGHLDGLRVDRGATSHDNYGSQTVPAATSAERQLIPDVGPTPS